MKEEKPKLPTKEGLKRAQERTREWLRKQPSDNLVRIIDEVTRDNVSGYFDENPWIWVEAAAR